MNRRAGRALSRRGAGGGGGGARAGGAPGRIRQAGSRAIRTPAIPAAYWLRVVLCPAAETRRPCGVMLIFWIFTPAGSFGMVTVKFTRLPRRSVGSPFASTSLTLILLSPTLVT